VLGELAFSRSNARPGHHPGDQPLAEVVVRLAGNRRLKDERMLEQRCLDLACADLEATGLDQVGRAPADDAEVAIPATGGQFARLEPAVDHRCGGGVGPVEVAEKEVRAADLHLADRLVVVLGQHRSVVVDEACVDAPQRRAHVSRPPLARAAGQAPLRPQKERPFASLDPAGQTALGGLDKGTKRDGKGTVGAAGGSLLSGLVVEAVRFGCRLPAGSFGFVTFALDGFVLRFRRRRAGATGGIRAERIDPVARLLRALLRYGFKRSSLGFVLGARPRVLPRRSKSIEPSPLLDWRVRVRLVLHRDSPPLVPWRFPARPGVLARKGA
jgi:hypothetical protein